MISSEVGRTLVKSPPELWAELSDPQTLARHLGELGVIRITRVEPEQRVEWESESASGAVTLKASGWGTKVTLSVTRELLAPGSRELPAAGPRELPADEADQPGDSPSSDATASAISTGASAAQTQDESASAPAGDGAHEPPRSLGAEIELTVAERFAAHDFEPLLGASHQFTAEEDTRGTLSPAAPAVEAAAAATASATEPEPATPPAPEREPRRRAGFFARLFGRRARPADERAGAAAATPPVTAAARPIEISTATAAAAAHTANAPRGRPGAEAEGVPPAPAPAPEPEPAAREIDEGAATTATSQPPEAPPQASAAPPETHAEASTQPQAEREAESSEEDLAAELRTAEESAVAEVEAVLSAVLDKLGAAHHRPFSRA
jgi:hypothetical protein